MNGFSRTTLITLLTPPDVFASDRDPALEAVVPRLMPTTFHIVCLHHMEGNLTVNLRSALGGEWNTFLGRFWAVYRAVCPEIFKSMWQQPLLDYPAAGPYLSSNLYPIRHRWAHPWISCRFTAGIRTNGRVESENRTNKILGGPKTSLVQLFENLNQRTREQVSKEQIAVRNVSTFIFEMMTIKLIVTPCVTGFTPEASRSLGASVCTCPHSL